MSSENAKQIERLIRFWPSSPVSDEAMRAYGEAIAGHNSQDVRKAVDRLINAEVKRNADYIPPPGQLAFQINRARQEREEWEERQKPRATALPPPVNAGSEAERRALVERLKAQMGGKLIRTISDIEGEDRKAHRSKVEAYILAAADGDAAALAEWRKATSEAA